MKAWKVATSVVSGIVGLSLVASPAIVGVVYARNTAVSLIFLQNKPEVVSQWNTLIAAFEKQNPNITVKQVNPPNTDTALQADVAKGQVPDVIAMGADATYIQMAKNGVFKDFTGGHELSNVSPAYVKMLEDEVGKPTPYALPYTVNAVPILYNVKLFHHYHLKVPTTWNQLIAEAKQVKAKGGVPFYNGYKDAWTLAIPWNALAANEEGSDASFFAKLAAGKTTLTANDRVSAARMIQLAALGESTQFGVDYNDANTGFAKGKSVFYVQGIWTLPVIRSTNPKIQLGSFVFPATNNPQQTKMVSGVDSLLTIANSGDSTKEAAAMKFMDFLLEKQNAAYYANQAGLFSTVKGVKVSDKTIVGLQTYINQGRVIDFPDHYYPPAMAAGNQYESTLQGALSNKSSATSILTQLDALYKQSAAHQ